MSDDVKRPVDKLNDGNLKASIWENESEKGTFHSVSFARTYRDKDGNLADTNHFSKNDLLKLSRLAEKSYDNVRERQSRAYAEQQRSKARNNTPERGRDR
nr:hypothetical protein [uncultured Cohaesibacter sp.]